MEQNYFNMKSIILGIFLLVITANTDAQNISALRLKAQQAKVFSIANKMDTTICFLIDMSIHSGNKRLFIWSYRRDTVLLNGMCSHGCCNTGWSVDDTKTSPTFSNVPDSHCSSLGKYKIGARGWSNFGIHINYKLHGLEAENNNAFKRYIVFHSWDVMSDKETYPSGSPESWGCPAVSNAFMKLADKQLQSTNGNVLMWIYK
jgi:hypothetical protein